MGTLTAGCPRLDSHCSHKLATSCRLTSTPNCCACADERPHSRLYRVYVDGVGFVYRGTRWQSYCWFCKEFWTNRLAATDPPLEPSQTQIPHVPDQTEFLERWFEFHQGYRVVNNPVDGSESRIAVIGEPFQDVSPGFLPRTLAQLREGRINDASRPENRIRRRRLTSEEERSEDRPQENIEDALDNLLAEVSDEETPPTLNAQPQRQERDVNSPPLSVNISRSRHLERIARIFGTREDVQRDDYVSPLATLYNRAEARYQQAEEQRANRNDTAPVIRSNIPAVEHVEPQAQVSQGPTNGDGIIEDSLQQYERALAMLRRQNLVRIESARLQGEAELAELSLRLHAVRSVIAAAAATPTNDTSEVSHSENVERIQRIVNPTVAAPSNSSASDVESQLRALYARDRPWLAETFREHRANGTVILHPTISQESDNYLFEVYFNAEFQRRRLREINRQEQTDRSNSNQTENLARAGRSTMAPPTMAPPTTAPPTTALPTTALPTTAPPTNNASFDLRSERINRARRVTYPWLFRPVGGLLSASTATLDSPERPPPLTDAEMTKNLACQVCYAQIANIALVPCGHMCMCVWCADMVVPLKNGQLLRPTRCPMCRKGIRQRIKVCIGG